MSIRTAQSALQQLGFDPGPIDNVNGERTRSAVRKFQSQHGLPPTGLLDDETWRAIIGQLTGN